MWELTPFDSLKWMWGLNSFDSLKGTYETVNDFENFGHEDLNPVWIQLMSFCVKTVSNSSDICYHFDEILYLL